MMTACAHTAFQTQKASLRALLWLGATALHGAAFLVGDVFFSSAGPLPEKNAPVNLTIRFDTPEPERVSPRLLTPRQSLPVEPPSPPVEPRDVDLPLPAQLPTAPTPTWRPQPAVVVTPDRPPLRMEIFNEAPAAADMRRKAPTERVLADAPLPTSPTDKPATVSGVSRPAKITKLAKKYYPPEARDKQQEGEVLVEVNLRFDGVVVGVRLVEETPYEALNQAALQMAQNMKFQPALVEGRPVSSLLLVPIRFYLE